ncbi:MAG: hypothetical protein Q8O14_14520 [bacterium]|nr:hypothetical protein [bacterium]
MIAHRFPAYTFELLDDLPFERVFDLAAAAEWLGDEERKANQGSRRSRARKR